MKTVYFVAGCACLAAYIVTSSGYFAIAFAALFAAAIFGGSK